MQGGGVSSRCGGRGAKSSVSPRGFSPWASCTGGAAGKSHTADICVCVLFCLPHLMLSSICVWLSYDFSVSLSSATPSSYQLLPSSFYSVLLLPWHLSSLNPNCSWFSASSVGYSFHINIYWIKRIKPLGFSPVVNLLHFTVSLSVFHSLCPDLKSNVISLCHHAALFVL